MRARACVRVCTLRGFRSTSRARRVIPVAWRDLVFVFRSITCVLKTDGPSRSLWENPRARENAVDVLLESISLCRPAYSQTASVCDVYPNSHPAARHVGPLGVLLSRFSPLEPYPISLSIVMFLIYLDFFLIQIQNRGIQC